MDITKLKEKDIYGELMEFLVKEKHQEKCLNKEDISLYENLIFLAATEICALRNVLTFLERSSEDDVKEALDRYDVKI